MIYQKQKGLAMESENFEKTHVTEIKVVIESVVVRVMKKKGGEKYGLASVNY